MHFVIIGNGVAGVTAARTIRERERKAEISVISGESKYFFSRTGLQDLQECERLTPSTCQAVVVGGGLIGVELVECLNPSWVFALS